MTATSSAPGGRSNAETGTATSARSTVFIPVVAPHPPGARDPEARAQANGGLLETYAASDSPLGADERTRLEATGLEPTAAGLRRSPQLYEAGVAAVAAFRKMRPKPPVWALHQRLWRRTALNDQQLHMVNPRGPTEGQSAELGLSLALFMNATGCNVRQIFATGALARLQRPVESNANAWRVDDIEVVEVGSISTKLALIRDAIDAGHFGDLRGSNDTYCFLPKASIDGTLSAMPEARDLESRGVKLIPVTWMSEALAVLGVNRTRATRSDRVVVGVLTALVLALALFAIVRSFANVAVPLAFEPGRDTSAAEPYVWCAGDRPSRAVVREGVRRRVPVGATLGWRIIIEESNTVFSQWLPQLGWSGYHLTHVLLSEHSPTKMQADPEPVPTGVVRGYWWQLDEGEETMALVVLATPFFALDEDELMQAIERRFPEHFGVAGEPLDITRAVNFVRGFAPGALSFVYSAGAVANPC